MDTQADTVAEIEARRPDGEIDSQLVTPVMRTEHEEKRESPIRNVTQ